MNSLRAHCGLTLRSSYAPFVAERLYLMLRSLANIIATLVLLAALAGCEEIASFAFTPYTDVGLTATVRKVSYHDFEIPGKTTFVHFKYNVTVGSDTPIYFKVGEVALSINGTKNNSAYYDTVVSMVPHWERMKKGENVIEAYASFPGTIDATEVTNLKFIHFGFSRDPKRRG